MATYNGEKYLLPQIQSILDQIDEKDELIISDDGSTDSTIEIINKIKDPRIRLLSNEGKKGVNGNFQTALRHAKGEYIFLADQDDVWLPGKVAHCIEALSTSKCIVHDCYVVNQDMEIMYESFFAERNSSSGLLHNWIRNGYLGCAMAFRREVLDIALPIPDHLPVWHDIWIGMLAEYKYGVKFIPFKGIYFRRHQSNTSVTAKSKFNLKEQIAYRIKILPYLFKRISTSHH